MIKDLYKYILAILLFIAGNGNSEVANAASKMGGTAADSPLINFNREASIESLKTVDAEEYAKNRLTDNIEIPKVESDTLTDSCNTEIDEVVSNAVIADTNIVELSPINLAITDSTETNKYSDLIIVDGDTISAILPEKLWGRYDRGMKNYLFMPTGCWSFGLTASFGTVDISDMMALDILTDLDFSSKIYAIHPEVSYAIGHNRSVGLRISYSEADINLENLDLTLMDDLGFSVSDMKYNNTSLSAAAFYRYYIGLDRAHRFGLFNEVDLTFKNSTGIFNRMYDESPRVTDSRMTKVSLNYSPGLCVFIQEYVSFNVSFGIFGIYYLSEEQVTNGIEDGSREAGGASFQFNLFNIRFGIAVHI